MQQIHGQLDISRAQINDYDTIYDFRNIGTGGATVRFDIQRFQATKINCI